MSDIESDPELITQHPNSLLEARKKTPKIYLTWTTADFQDSRALRNFLKKIGEVFKAHFVSGEGVSILLHV